MFSKLALFLAVFSVGSAWAEVKTGAVEYASKGAPLEGYAAYDDSLGQKRPGILIVHDWMGLGDFAKQKADLLAKQGYVAFAADIYGKGVRPKSPAEAGKLAGSFKKDRELLRARIRAAYDALIAMPQVDPQRIVVMGYCFGGTTALELARSGAPLRGTVSFHGGLSTPAPQDARHIRGKLLVLHGADDPNVPPSEVAAFKKEMRDAGVKMRFIAYPGAVHAFTNPAAGNDNSKGAAYNAEADHKSWQEFESFLHDVLGG